MISAGSRRSLSPIVTPWRSSMYSARPTGFFNTAYASFNARDFDSAATRSAAGADAKRSGCSSFDRSKNARSITWASRSNRAGKPSSSNASELDRLSTATRALGVRVVELEPVTHHPLHEVEAHAAEVHERLRIDDDADALAFRRGRR